MQPPDGSHDNETELISMREQIDELRHELSLRQRSEAQLYLQAALMARITATQPVRAVSPPRRSRSVFYGFAAIGAAAALPQARLTYHLSQRLTELTTFSS